MRFKIIFLLALAGTAHATGTIFSTLLSGIGQDYAGAVTSDANGNTYVAGETYSKDFPVTAGAYQTVFGQTADAFVAKLGPDGKIVWATFLGGILTDAATGIALDSAGNVWVAGWTVSPDFPVVNPIQGAPADGYAAFVAEFDPTGSKLLFSTCLGGQTNSSGFGIAVDAGGNAYVATNTSSAAGFPGLQNPPGQGGIVVSKISPKGTLVYSFFHPGGTAQAIAIDSLGAAYVAGSTEMVDYNAALETFQNPGSQLALAFKISPDGSAKVYEKTFGGSTESFAQTIAVDSAGEAWVGGGTASADFPLVKPLQSTSGALPLEESTDGGATWTGVDALPFALPEMMAVDPTTPATLYEATADLGIFKSINGGVDWTQANSGIASTNTQAVTVDPASPQIVYAASATTLYKSIGGAATWTAIDTPGYPITQILVDPQNDKNVYTVCTNTGPGYKVFFRKSTDGGQSWANISFPQSGGVAAVALDPHVSGVIVALSTEVITFGGISGTIVPSYLYRSTDGGNTWTQSQAVPATSGLIADGSTTPTTYYNGLTLRSTDGGITWSPLPSPPANTANSYPPAMAVDSSGTVYAGVTSGFYVSHDHGTTWTQVAASDPVTYNLTAAGSTLFTAVNQVATGGFVSKLSADGSSFLFSTYLSAHATLAVPKILAAEPEVLYQENWVSGLALDFAGDVVVAGGTRGTDFPVVLAAQPANAGGADAFAATISPDGSRLLNSTYYGGSQDDGALAAAVDRTGNLIFAGQTFSGDFPGGGGSLPYSYGDAFVVKLGTGTPLVSSILNGASFQPGIESGSWAQITGANLADTTRLWTSADFNGPDLPTSLSGVSVSIDGKPAPVYYISPTQINVQVPTDSTLGNVAVVVDNNGVFSPPAPVPLQSYAPAFFTWLVNPYAIASRLPDYDAVGSPSAPAHPGDELALWGTGFGPTTPMAPAGVEVSGLDTTVTLPTVTVGGVEVQVLGAALAPGTAGLYQINIQLPANLPTGTVALQASIGGATTPTGTSLFIQ